MATDSPGPRPERPESRWTRLPPATPAQQLARELIDEDLRASAGRAQPQPSQASALARLREWLRRTFRTGETAAAQSQPDQARLTKQPPPSRGNGAPGAEKSSEKSPKKSAREKVAAFSIPELQQVLHATLERISQDPQLQQAYKDGKLPIVEDLLRRTEPARKDPSPRTSPASGTSQSEPVTSQREPVTSRTEAVTSRSEPAQRSVASSTMGDFTTTAHPAAPSDRPSATVNFSESTAHPTVPPSDRQQAVASQNPAPSNPVSDMRALTFNLNVNVNVTQEAPRSKSGSATRPAVTQPQSGAGRSRAVR